MNDLFCVRHATVKDASAIAQIHLEGWQKDYQKLIAKDYLDNLTFENRLEHRLKILSSHEEKSIHLVGLCKNKIVGFCNAGLSREPKNSKGEIYSLYILDKYKNKGLGTTLIKMVQIHFKEFRLFPYIICTLEGNKVAREFYEKHGGKMVYIKQVSIGNQLYNEVVYMFEKALS